MGGEASLLSLTNEEEDPAGGRGAKSSAIKMVPCVLLNIGYILDMPANI